MTQDFQKPNTKRNNLIYKLYKQGMSEHQITAEINKIFQPPIGRTRVSQIKNREIAKRNK